jgi:hypothetical protein
MTCSHVLPDESLGLPCAWPGCPDGTPKETVAVMHGESGVLRKSMPGPKYEIEAQDGVTLYRRHQTTTGWEWQSA